MARFMGPNAVKQVRVELIHEFAGALPGITPEDVSCIQKELATNRLAGLPALLRRRWKGREQTPEEMALLVLIETAAEACRREAEERRQAKEQATRQRQAEAANAQRWQAWAEAMGLPWHVVGMVTGAPFSEAAAAQVLEAWRLRQQARQRTRTNTSASGWAGDGDDLAQALRVLGLQRPFSHADVRRRKRELARQHHPDQGGDLEAMQRINQAADLALRWAAA